MRKQRECFEKKDGGASFIRPEGCTTDCDKNNAEFNGKICVEIHANNDKDRNRFQNIEFKKTNFCPYSESTTSLLRPNEDTQTKCRRFKEIKRLPFIKIFTNETHPVSYRFRSISPESGHKPNEHLISESKIFSGPY